MARYAYDRLTALDNSFLILEKPNAYMHVASTMIFDAGPLATPEGGIDADSIKQVFASGRQEVLRADLRLRKALDRVASESKRIPLEVARAREEIWTPDKESQPTETKLWTPGSKEPA